MPSRTAFKQSKNPYAKWADSLQRMEPEVFPQLAPKFRMPAKGKIFTIGSCFARNIEEHFARIGYEVPTLDFSVPREEWAFRPNGILNKLTPSAIWQELDWIERAMQAGKITDELLSELFFECKNGLVIDMDLGGYVPVSRERAIERRKQHFEVYKNLFDADILTITLGNIEAWYDTKTKRYLHELPSHLEMVKAKERFELIILSHTQCSDLVRRSIELVRHRNPSVKILVTTSPVPLGKTFSGQDIIIANLHGKSTLRSVCGEIILEYENVDYFPSYESVMLTPHNRTFEADRRHVKDDFVAKVVGTVAENYLTEQNFTSTFLKAKGLQNENPHQALTLCEEALTVANTNEEELSARTLEWELMSTLAPPEEALALGEALAKDLSEEIPRSEVIIKISELYAQMGEHQKAKESATLAIKLNPRRVWWKNILAQALNNLGQYDDAIALLQDACQEMPTDPWIKCCYAEMLMPNDSAQAQRVLNRVFQISPNNFKAMKLQKKLAATT